MVASLATWPSSSTTPQCPWSVYSSRHRSAMITSSCTSLRSDSRVCWTTPGNDVIATGSSMPSRTNRGAIRSSTDRWVSATRRRRAGVRRSRRSRRWGKLIAMPPARQRAFAASRRVTHCTDGSLADARSLRAWYDPRQRVPPPLRTNICPRPIALARAGAGRTRSIGRGYGRGASSRRVVREPSRWTRVVAFIVLAGLVASGLLVLMRDGGGRAGRGDGSDERPQADTAHVAYTEAVRAVWTSRVVCLPRLGARHRAQPDAARDVARTGCDRRGRGAAAPFHHTRSCGRCERPGGRDRHVWTNRVEPHCVEHRRAGPRAAGGGRVARHNPP